MENEQRMSLKGHFIIAMPSLMDPNFFQTVTCISEHTPEGAVGLVVNRAHPSLTGKMIFDELKIPCEAAAVSVPVFIGGPVHEGEIFILHGPPFGWEGCLQITQFLAMSNTKDILESIAMTKGPDEYIIALGCAGWGQGQLESEITQNAWLSCPVEKEIIFETTVAERWGAVLKNMGIDPSLLSDTAGHA